MILHLSAKLKFCQQNLIKTKKKMDVTNHFIHKKHESYKRYQLAYYYGINAIKRLLCNYLHGSKFIWFHQPVSCVWSITNVKRENVDRSIINSKSCFWVFLGQRILRYFGDSFSNLLRRGFIVFIPVETFGSSIQTLCATLYDGRTQTIFPGEQSSSANTFRKRGFFYQISLDWRGPNYNRQTVRRSKDNRTHATPAGLVHPATTKCFSDLFIKSTTTVNWQRWRRSRQVQ